MDKAFNSILESDYQRYYHKLYLHAYSILGQASEAETAVQETFVVACKKSAQFINSENHFHWLKKTVEYMSLHILRERKRTMAIFLPLDELNAKLLPTEQPDNCIEIIDFFQSIVSNEELDFFLRIVRHETSFLDEAKKNNIKISACYKRFERIRNKLQRALEESSTA